MTFIFLPRDVSIMTLLTKDYSKAIGLASDTFDANNIPASPATTLTELLLHLHQSTELIIFSAF